MTGCSKTSCGDWNESNPDDAWRRLERRLLWVNAIAIAVLIVFFMAACSPTKQIATTTTAINEAAASSKDRFAVIHAEATDPTPDLPLIAEQAVGGQHEQQAILDHTSTIHRALPGVEDKVPEWVYLLQYIAIGLSILGVGWILWHTGIGTLIKRLIGFVPKAKRQEAMLAREVLDDSRPATVREYVAARRAADPEFNEAYVRARPRSDSPVRKDAGPHAGV